MVVAVVMAFGVIIVLVGLYLLIRNVTTPGNATLNLPGGTGLTVSGPSSFLVVLLGAGMLTAPLWLKTTIPAPAPAPTPTPTPTPTLTPGPAIAVAASPIPFDPVKPPEFPTAYDKPHGQIAKLGGEWHETDASNGMNIAFKEVSRDQQYTILFDEGRDLYLRIPTRGGEVDWAHSNPMIWVPLYEVSVSKGSQSD